MKKRKKIFVILGVFLILLSAFQNKIFAFDPVIDGAREYMSDMLEDSLNNGEISQECYEQLKKQAGDELTKAEMTQKLKENLFFFAVGQYANISQDVVANSLLSLSDIWDYIFWDSSTQSFGFDKDIGDYIKGGLDDVIHSVPQDTIGNWYPLPVTVSISNQSASQRQYFVSDSSVYMCCISKSGSGDWTKCDLAFAIKGSDTATYTFYGGTYSVDTSYVGSVDSGFYAARYGTYFHDIGIAPTSWTVYSSLSVALEDFFGTELSSEPILHDAVIVNENPVFPSLSPLGALNPNYKEIVINNYNNENPYPPNRGLDINYYDYDYNYDVPYWGGEELETLAYPEEIEFPSLEFETIEVDPNVDTALESLDGSWIVDFLLIAILLLIVGLIL